MPGQFLFLKYGKFACFTTYYGLPHTPSAGFGSRAPVTVGGGGGDFALRERLWARRVG